MKTIKVKAPAKINLTLEILNKREDGYHNIKSVMQAINLFDYLTFNVTESNVTEIDLSGNTNKIPYNEKNLVHKACREFIKKTGLENFKYQIYIEKNIPIEAGLAGGSTDAAATFFALNKLFDNPITTEEINQLCASIGSDLNFCLLGGRALCTGRGEQIKKIQNSESAVTLIKPKSFGISAREAYTKFSQLKDKPLTNYSERIIETFNEKFLYNGLEKALIDDYDDLKEIKKLIPSSIMSGSGPTYFVLSNRITAKLDEKKYQIIEDLEFIDYGVSIA